MFGQMLEYPEMFYSWAAYVPGFENNVSCELECKGHDHETNKTIIRKMRLNATDGTPCWQTGYFSGICISGKCLSIGCDNKLFSNLTLDTCGTCGGRGITCKRVNGVFSRSQVHPGYIRMITIPVGTTSIGIKMKSPSARSTKIIVSSKNGGMIFGGPSKTTYLPGTAYSVGDLTFYYFSPSGNDEIVISANGTLNDSMKVMAQATAYIPVLNITYEYSIHNQNVTTTNEENLINNNTTDKLSKTVSTENVPTTGPTNTSVPTNINSIRSITHAQIETLLVGAKVGDDLIKIKTVDEISPLLFPSKCRPIDLQSNSESRTSCDDNLLFQKYEVNKTDTLKSVLREGDRVTDASSTLTNVVAYEELNKSLEINFVEPNIQSNISKSIIHHIRRNPPILDLLDLSFSGTDTDDSRKRNGLENCSFFNLPRSKKKDKHISLSNGYQNKRRKGLDCDKNKIRHGRVKAKKLLRLKTKTLGGIPSSRVVPENESKPQGQEISTKPSLLPASLPVLIREEFPTGGTFSFDGHRHQKKGIVISSSQKAKNVPSSLIKNVPTINKHIIGIENQTHEGHHKEPDSNQQSNYSWKVVGKTQCSSTCYSGLQENYAQCFKDEELLVADYFCDYRTRPKPEVNFCPRKECKARWDTSAWSECSASCGKGYKTRSVRCWRMLGPGFDSTVHERLCAELIKPPSIQPCDLDLCSPQWRVSEWSECSVKCGYGVQVREVHCSSIIQSCSENTKPNNQQECFVQSCQNRWTLSLWSKCSGPCGVGIEWRNVTCRDPRGSIVDDLMCNEGDHPLTVRACGDRPNCPPVWVPQEWSKCSVNCGFGVQRRLVICGAVRNTEFRKLGDTSCRHLNKPASLRRCRQELCKPEWFTTPWSKCSSTCGRGVRAREVRCFHNGHSAKGCNPKERPPPAEVCILPSCPEPEVDPPCVDNKLANCGLVVRARLCNHRYYKQACCFSCRKFKE
ncbi:ADAMTS-like protein 2 [Tachypleus tridentatus]|uniref:ADAMTS-like protein 2 n=1 Tax=Tachypleus tridentatus TaxID=6853 RepID=UPI003FD5359E